MPELRQTQDHSHLFMTSIQEMKHTYSYNLRPRMCCEITLMVIKIWMQ